MLEAKDLLTEVSMPSIRLAYRDGDYRLAYKIVSYISHLLPHTNGIDDATANAVDETYGALLRLNDILTASLSDRKEAKIKFGDALEAYLRVLNDYLSDLRPES